MRKGNAEVPEVRSLSLYVPFWVNGTDKRLVCVGCRKVIKMKRVYHFQLCEDCRTRMFHLVVSPMFGRGS